MCSYDTWLTTEPPDLLAERDEALDELDRELNELEDVLNTLCTEQERDAAMARRDQIIVEIDRIEER